MISMATGELKVIVNSRHIKILGFNFFDVDRKGHGATKAAVRACRNAIEFNSIPCISELVPGGRPNMKIKIKLGVPSELLELCQVWPEGHLRFVCPR